MDAVLSELLAPRAAHLAAALEREIRSPDAPHYRGTPPDVLRARCERLVSSFLESVRAGGSGPFVAYVRTIAEERIAEGFFLAEVQQALSALEAQVWPLVVKAGGDVAEVARRLAVVSGIVGRAKDELARVFLAHKERADARVALLERRLAELFKGTTPPPEG